MSEGTRWRYYAAYCYFKVTKKGGVLSGPMEGYWSLKLDTEMGLSEGLDYMGGCGWELVGIQQSNMMHGGGGVADWYYPACFYIFKKAIE